MSSQPDQSVYYVPHSGWYPVWIAFGAFMLLAGLGTWLNEVKGGEDPSGSSSGSPRWWKRTIAVWPTNS